MSNSRTIDVEIATNENYSMWNIVVACPRGKELTAQDIIDALADALMNDGKLDPYAPTDRSQLDS